MRSRFIRKHLTELFEKAEVLSVSNENRIVILSDLHLGNGGRQDDFKKNSEMIISILKENYLKKKFQLILNGDIEELLKFSLRKIMDNWPRFFAVLKEFQKQNLFFKTIGNHDYALLRRDRYIFFNQLSCSLKLEYNKNQVFIFHGHQASVLSVKLGPILAFAVKYIARPLGLKNYSTAYNNRKKYRVEKRVHDFSKSRKIVSIIGHTHRPLFESMSKIDELKFRIENLIRLYTYKEGGEKKDIANDIRIYRDELRHYYEKDRKIAERASLYNSPLVIPCLFNSGCGVGKRGITAIEIEDGKISLVYWYQDRSEKEYIKHYDDESFCLRNRKYIRVVLKKESLDYIFSRIYLLTN